MLGNGKQIILKITTMEIFRIKYSFVCQVELPSQFMENWLYDWTTMKKIAGHYKTGEILPKEIFQQILKGLSGLSF